MPRDKSAPLRGAACVTVIEDREGDIYECFAFKPANVEKLVRAAQAVERRERTVERSAEDAASSGADH